MITDVVFGFHIGVVIYTALATILCIAAIGWYLAQLIMWCCRAVAAFFEEETRPRGTL